MENLCNYDDRVATNSSLRFYIVKQKRNMLAIYHTLDVGRLFTYIYFKFEHDVGYSHVW